MTAPGNLLPSEAARGDARERSVLHARHCVRFAVVTSPAVAADLIDRAIELHAVAGSARAANRPA